MLMPALHTFHMHGYRFAVLKVAYGLKNVTAGTIVSRHGTDYNCSTDYCSDIHWLNDDLKDLNVDRPPLKDNLLIPVGGYAVVRIYTDNPGYWLAHCHQSSHLWDGMSLVFDIEGESAKKTIPPNFPTCGNFILDPPN
ncbi:hypothetical protein EB796_008518 [Bugula neritina]|uniref:Plastocyanin-like domain-containing protein n=1 Tax=Bugula neritina TaxID=10212 RepID=A0A7J7K3I3_BUGNE|nr:hypothetical protein EB796_008518 [Bugula neritina]